MADWRLAKSLVILTGELNSIAPNRSKKSDGTIGNEAHRRLGSATDHNPWIRDNRGVGVVRAADYTHDPSNGLNAGDVANKLRLQGKAGDRRIRYIISNRRIASEKQNWAWRPYSGLNAHSLHFHVSVSTEQRFYDSEEPWGFLKIGPAYETEEEMDMVTPETIAQGIRQMQADVNFITNFGLKQDGVWGGTTQKGFRQMCKKLNIWIPDSDKDRRAKQYTDWMARMVERERRGQFEGKIMKLVGSK